MSRPTPRTLLSRSAVAAIGLGALVAGCSSDDDTASESTTSAGEGSTTTSAAATSSTAATSTTASSGSLPAPPSGAQELQSSSADGVVYARYQISGTTAEQVVADYQSELQSAGYTVSDSGGGGGGWGKWGGAGAGVTAEGDGGHVAVQAGGQSGGPVYFEVCQGASSSAVQECEDQSDGPDDNDSSGEGDDDSSSGGS
jgi:hypothetical protein